VIVFANRPLTRSILSWSAAGLGLLIGFCTLVSVGLAWVYNDFSSPDWLPRWIIVFGLGLLAGVFLVASFLGLRNRRRGGLSFLIGMPIVAFCLAYPEAGLWYTAARGEAGIYLPDVRQAIAPAFVFFLPFAVALLAIRKTSRRRALVWFLASASISSAILCISDWTRLFLWRLTPWSALFLAFGAFWLATDKRGWPPLHAPIQRSLTRQIAGILVTCLVVAALDLAATLTFAAMRSSLWTPDCSGSSLFAKAVTPNQEVFTARLIRTGHTVKVAGRWAGDWGIGTVQEQFWGLPRWMPRVVLLTNNIYWEGETFFVSGGREQGLLTRYLPIVEATSCGSIYARPLSHAELELRILREPRTANESRVLGTVWSFQHRSPQPITPRPRGAPTPKELELLKKQEDQRAYEWALKPPRTEIPLPGVRIRLNGPSSATVIKTDEHGIYEFAGLRPDDYTLTLLDPPPDHIAAEVKLTKKLLNKSQLSQLDMYVYWDGTIEGAVKDVDGNPVRTYVELWNAEGTQLSPDASGSAWTGDDGSYTLGNLPVGGRYTLRVNPAGPTDDAPFPALYYPSDEHRAEARALEITSDRKRLKNVDFTLRRLAEHTLQVRATWPNGQPIEGAVIHAALEHTSEWEEPATASRFWETDAKGVAQVHLFGNSRVRVLAEKFVDDQKSTGPSPRYSQIIELEPTKPPHNLDLVVPSSSLRPPG
jgi:hypothetical protein